MFVRWNFTVCSVIQNSPLIAWFESPLASALKDLELSVRRPARIAAAVVFRNTELEPLAGDRAPQGFR